MEIWILTVSLQSAKWALAQNWQETGYKLGENKWKKCPSAWTPFMGTVGSSLGPQVSFKPPVCGCFFRLSIAQHLWASTEPNGCRFWYFSFQCTTMSMSLTQEMIPANLHLLFKHLSWLILGTFYFCLFSIKSSNKYKMNKYYHTARVFFLHHVVGSLAH